MLEAQKEALKSKHREQLHMLNELSHRLQSLLTAENLYKETLKIVEGHFQVLLVDLDHRCRRHREAPGARRRLRQLPQPRLPAQG